MSLKLRELRAVNLHILHEYIVHCPVSIYSLRLFYEINIYSRLSWHDTAA